MYQKMSLLKKFRTLPPLQRASIGGAFLTWGTLGLYLSESAERKLGFEASAREKEELEGMMPRISVVEREGRKGVR
ncbi:hypothetical protein HYALB_00004503 [Hymenoscyphus albidus]|uniref:Uncharacterized protein n=1 Tax=Hymenoscyphus albidus TaxID=595503 RepID=A0A9N9M1C2_9HELO|nr:hypothetical protein HYALB_00004503 [Hymenoscyphus albidus]